MAEQVGFRDQYAGVHARGMLPQRPDPLAGFRDNLSAALALLETTPVVILVTLGRRRANRVTHAVEAARREVRRALEAMGPPGGASAGSG
jgi:hypothetical protein